MKKFSCIVAVYILCVCALPFRLGAQGDLQAPAPKITAGKNGKPNWVHAPYAAYDKKYYLAAVGQARSRAGAEANALGNLSGYFGQSVTNEVRAAESHREKRSKERSDQELAQALQTETRITSEVDHLLGAEIGAVWQDGKTDTYYALAVMNRARSAALYTALLTTSTARRALLDEPADDPPTLDDVARLYSAAKNAGQSERYARILYLLNGTNRAYPAAREDAYRQQARAAAQHIPVYITVHDDSDNKIHAALSGVLTRAGFATSDTPARYTLEARCKISRVDLPNQPNTFARYELDVALKDTRAGVTLTTFTAAGRQGHIGWDEAAARALRAATADITSKFPEALGTYLSGAAAPVH